MVNKNGTITNKEGCEYGRRIKLKTESIEDKLDDILKNQKTLFNHMSSRVDPELLKKISTLYGILGTIIGISITAIVTLIITLV